MIYKRDMKKECDKAIKEWEEFGGFLNSYETGSLFIEDESVYKYWLKEEKLEDTEENGKRFCKSALEYCGMYSDEEIEEIMSRWQKKELINERHLYQVQVIRKRQK